MGGRKSVDAESETFVDCVGYQSPKWVKDNGQHGRGVVVTVRRVSYSGKTEGERGTVYVSSDAASQIAKLYKEHGG